MGMSELLDAGLSWIGSATKSSNSEQFSPTHFHIVERSTKPLPILRVTNTPSLLGLGEASPHPPVLGKEGIDNWEFRGIGDCVSTVTSMVFTTKFGGATIVPHAGFPSYAKSMVFP